MKLTQIVPDFREALEEGVQDAAQTVVRDLQEAGPYWTGFFSDVWQVNAGNYAVKPNIANPLDVPRTPNSPKDFVTIDVPESPNLGGYTIGNRAKYRLIAMDIVGDRGDREGATASKNWYDLYINSRMRTAVNRSIQNVFRRYS